MKVDSHNYGDKADRTVARNYEEVLSRLTPEKIDLLHAILGLNGEVGELTEAFKKHLFYGKPLDNQDMAKEVGDMYWYSALAVKCLKTTINEIMPGNIEKLKKRYPEQFSEKDAIERKDVNETT